MTKCVESRSSGAIPARGFLKLIHKFLKHILVGHVSVSSIYCEKVELVDYYVKIVAGENNLSACECSK